MSPSVVSLFEDAVAGHLDGVRNRAERAGARGDGVSVLEEVVHVRHDVVLALADGESGLPLRCHQIRRRRLRRARRRVVTIGLASSMALTSCAQGSTTSALTETTSTHTKPSSTHAVATSPSTRTTSTSSSSASLREPRATEHQERTSDHAEYENAREVGRGADAQKDGTARLASFVAGRAGESAEARVVDAKDED